MRSLPLAFLVTLLVLVSGPARVRADDPPPATPDAAADADPVAAWGRLNRDISQLPYAQRRDALKQGAEAAVAAWKATGRTADAKQLYHLGLLQRSAEQWTEAAGSFRLVGIAEGVPADLAGSAASAEAGLLGDSRVRDALGAESVAKALKRLLAHAAGMTAEDAQATRGNMQFLLANALEAVERKAEAHDLRVALAERDPAMVGRVYRSLVWGLLGESHDLAAYDGVRQRAEPLLAMLGAQQQKEVEQRKVGLEEAREALAAAKPDALDAQGELVQKDRRAWSQLERVYDGAQRQLRGAESLVTRIADAGKPFEMLGRPAPAWTLEHAFGDCTKIEDLHGKVVVMDFWATWCPWCIRSFPAIRDLLRDLREKGLAFVGVTATSGSVYAARYDLDDDLKDKAVAGERVQPTARLAREGTPADGVTTFAPEAYAAKERETIATFIGNHQMTWPVVMIEKAEPSAKYALGGWPHAVVLDRAGRVRYFKSGALLRDRAEAVAHFRKVLEDLLAETAPAR